MLQEAINNVKITCSGFLLYLMDWFFIGYWKLACFPFLSPPWSHSRDISRDQIISVFLFYFILYHYVIADFVMYDLFVFEIWVTGFLLWFEKVPFVLFINYNLSAKCNDDKLKRKSVTSKQINKLTFVFINMEVKI